VVDFGIARAIDGIDGEATTTAARRITESGVSLGTVLYMSPEQATGDVVDARTDVYALGCVLHEMLTGEPPFTGASARVILARHLMDSPPSVRTARPTVGAALAQVVVRAMAKAPADRFASGAAFRDALRRAMAEDEGRPVTSPTGTGPTGTGARPAAGGGRAPRTRGRRVALGAAAALTVAAVALAARRGSGAAALDPNRVTVFPLRTVGTTPRAAGEDVATMLGTALDRAGPLRWVDGWRLLDGAARADPNLLPLARAAALARAQRSRYFVTGRLVPRGDSVEVVVELNDAARDPGDTAAVVDRASARGPAAEPWRGGLRAFNRLLPRLIPGGAPDPGEEWVARDPAAVARFLLGEAAFRRVHLGEALDHYRAAVAADSAFAWAAVRGAQAATWNHRAGEAAALIRVALAHPLPPRDGHFARGYAAYVDGRPDSAAAEFAAR
jgi:serine/threonine-protein kinase